MDTIVEAAGLYKRYGSLVAVDHVSFSVFRGEVFGILGPNGAGKTTTLEMLEGLRTPDDGHAIVDGIDVGIDPRGVRARIGTQLQEAGFFDRLTVEETLELFGSFHRKMVPPETVIARLNLDEKRRAWVETLSGGQRQRLSIAVALINDPTIVFLDEPTTGLDPQARHNLWAVIKEIRDEGRTVVLTTHYMEEAQQLCDRVAIMDHGHIVALDAPRALIRQHSPGTTVAISSPSGSAAYSGLPGVQHLQAHNGEVVLVTTEPLRTVQGLLERQVRGDLEFQQLRVEESTLEDVFLQLTGRRLRE